MANEEQAVPRDPSSEYVAATSTSTYCRVSEHSQGSSRTYLGLGRSVLWLTSQLHYLVDILARHIEEWLLFTAVRDI